MKKIAGLIVNIRYLIFLLIGITLAFSAISSRWVKVENDLVEYLPETSETRVGQKLMKEQFFTYGSAEAMIANITVEDAERLCKKIEALSSVKSVDFDSESTNYYNDVSALYQITFEYSEDDERCMDAIRALRECTADYDAYIESDAENTLEETIEQEVSVIIIYIAVIVLIVLLLTTTSFGEVPVLVITFVVAMLLNNGSNFLLGKISFVSNSVTSILQLALSLDYAIILCNHYKEEHRTLPVKEAVVEALAKAMPEIGSGCLTTLGGFVAMLFMSFKLGGDMGICLMKAVIISILTVFILMPGLLVMFGPLIDKTKHRTVVPNMQILGRFAYRTRKIVPPLFLILIIAAFMIQKKCPYVFGYGSITTPKQNESQLVDKMIEDTFTNPGKLAVIVPTGDYEKEGRLIKELEELPEIDHITGLANSEAMDGYMVTDCISPRQFSELLDIDYDSAQLLYTAYAVENEELSKIAGGLNNYRIRIMDMLLFVDRQLRDGVISLEGEDADTLTKAADSIESGKKQLLGKDFSRIIVYLKQEIQDKKAYDCIDGIRSICQDAYPNGEVYVIGELTNEYDFKKSFESDNIKVSVISILIVLTVLLFTFRSIAMPILLILVIQGSIWINFAIPAITKEPLMFMANLVVSAIQMGANIDYAIVIGSRYMEVRPHMDKKDAIAETMRFAFPTIMTSGTILAVAGILIGGMTSEATIVGIGQSVGRGTIISMILVLFVLPQILLLGEGLITRTAVSFKSLIDREGIKGMICLLICTGLVLTSPMNILAQTGAETGAGTKAIEISTEEDLKALADKCSLDSWSEGKTVELKEDIALIKYRDISVPVFSGEFNGNGHEISGLSINAQTGNAGLFCLVTEGGRIHNLKVRGELNADDADLVIGGLAGKNEGLIYECSFDGQLEGESTAGCIAGRNSETGTIRNCRTYGFVSAKTVCGGIAGENRGNIYGCTNYCDINSVASDPGLSIDAVESASVFELGKLVAPESYGITRDIGGICGKTSGRIVRCVNNGQVGTDHIGYNIGGITGRNTGFISRCSNNGAVSGRKDIGGIAGQAEPYTEVSMTADRVAELERQTEELNESVAELEGQLDGLSYGTQLAVSGMLGTVRDINTDMQSLKNAVDGKLEQASDQLEDTQDGIDRITGGVSDAADGLVEASDGLTSMASDYVEKVNELAALADMAEDKRNKLKDEAQNITREAAVVSDSIRELLKAVKDIKADPEAGYQKIRRCVTEIRNASGEISEAVNRITELLKDIPDIDGGLKESIEKSGKEVSEIASGISTAADGLNRISYYSDDITGFDTEITSSAISSSVEKMLSDLDGLSDQAEKLNMTLTDEKTKNTVREIFGISEDIGGTLTGSIRDLEDSDDYITDGTSEDIEGMTKGKIEICINYGPTNGDINAGGIAGAMAIENDNDPEGDSAGISEIYRKRYKLKDAVTDCTNYGTVSIKKNYCGGICGKQDTGIIKNCNSFGNIHGGEARYVGGIAGGTSAEIDSCSSKCILEGRKFVGGITGTGQDEETLKSESLIRDCISMVTLPEDAVFTGMIAGSDKGSFINNRFVSDSAAGIAGASFRGKAEPVPYAVLAGTDSIPEEFRTVNVYFTLDDELIETRKVKYGEAISIENYPELTSTEGYYGRWLNPTEEPIRKDTVIMAQNLRDVRALNSNIKRSENSDRPMFIAEGHYTGDSVFTVEEKGDGLYLLRIPHDGSSIHSIRYDPDGKDVSKLKITYSDETGADKNVDIERFGRCARFRVEGEEVLLHIR